MRNQLKILFLGVYLIGVSDSLAPTLNVTQEVVFRLEFNAEGNAVSPLVVGCTGSEPLFWSTHIPEDYYITTSATRVSPFGYQSTFVLPEPFPADTGYLSCAYQSGESASTYIYVDDGDAAFVLATENHHTAEFEKGYPLSLDCRPVNPDIKVTVYDDRKKEFNASSVDFDPKTGVVLHVKKNYVGTKLTCKNDKYPHKKLEFIIKNIAILSLAPPTISMHYNAHFIVGKRFTLNCSIPMNEKHDVKFQWSIPNRAPTSKLAPSHMDSTPGAMFARSSFTVENATLKNSGLYKCSVFQGNQEVSANTTVNVTRSMKSFVNFKTKQDGPNFLFAKESGPMDFLNYFKAFPAPLTHQFFGPLGEITEGENVTIEYNYDDGKLRLEVRNLTAYNFGNYTAVLTTPDGTRGELSGYLIVNATPVVTIDMVRSEFHIEENISLTASILSYIPGKKTLPDVSWFFYTNCPNGIGSCDTSEETTLNHTAKRRFSNSVQSNVSFTAESSGLLLCHVQDDFGNATARTPLILYDKNAGIFFVTIATKRRGTFMTLKKKGKGSVAPKINLIEGDNTTIECYGLDFVYQNLQFTPNDGVTEMSSGLYSGLHLNWMETSRSMEGTYECSATNRNSSSKETIAFELIVDEQYVPRLLNSSNMGMRTKKPISVELSNNFNISCFVVGSPMPTITWFKDGRKIKDIPDLVDNKERGFLRNDNQTLEFKFAQKDHEGTYSCRAENRAGFIKPQASVTVMGMGMGTFGISLYHWILIGTAVSFITFVV